MIKNKLIKDNSIIIYSISCAALIIMFSTFKVNKKTTNNLEELIQKASFIADNNLEFKGYINLYDITKFAEKEITLLTLKEIKNKKPVLLWNWYSLKELKENSRIDFSKNNKFFVYTRNKQ